MAKVVYLTSSGDGVIQIKLAKKKNFAFKIHRALHASKDAISHSDLNMSTKLWISATFKKPQEPLIKYSTFLILFITAA